MDRELELQKIQTLDNHFQAWFNFASSILASGFVGLIIVIVTLYFERSISLFAYVAGFIVVYLILGVCGLLFMSKQYNRFLKIVDDLLVKLEKDEPLPSIVELKKMTTKKK